MHPIYAKRFYQCMGLIRFLSMVDHLYAGEDKGRDYGCSAEGANLAVNLSGKRTLIGRNSGERRRYGRPPKGKTYYIGKLSGFRTEKKLKRAFSVLFCAFFTS